MLVPNCGNDLLHFPVLNKLFDASFIKSRDAPEYCPVGVRIARIPPSRHFSEGLQGLRPQPLEQLRRLGTSQHHQEYFGFVTIFLDTGIQHFDETIGRYLRSGFRAGSG
jgi:hypothetical protein